MRDNIPALLLEILAKKSLSDLGWLFETKQNRSCRADEQIVVSDSLSYGDSASWPCARQLPEADIYALPFTVLF
ncbi:putative mediator of RNA polymerase II transcription subunit 26 [Prunus yedoensis var. nudiflora]|uniref:Putative mediator of RNA polymerase II transcription subunit 26 n=1 Tax=Prunus yedoensis var. nudiflora TaxID=2094558 RepID=A0A314U6U8_PRUYE|nr:putative mediator of RNA polymerase II transcription subunit 26 [Prunus yedoensis var. nudiflora]